MRDCVCGFAAKLDPRTAAWHRAHRAVHLEVYPRVDLATRRNLDALVDVFEQREEAERVEQAAEERA